MEGTRVKTCTGAYITHDATLILLVYPSGLLLTAGSPTRVPPPPFDPALWSPEIFHPPFCTTVLPKTNTFHV